MKIVRDNEKTYATPQSKTYKMEVEFVLDMVPGAFAQPQDLMEWICQNSYVKQVTFDVEQMENKSNNPDVDDDLKDVLIIVDSSPRFRSIVGATRDQEKAKSIADKSDDFQIVNVTGHNTSWK